MRGGALSTTCGDAHKYVPTIVTDHSKQKKNTPLLKNASVGLDVFKELECAMRILAEGKRGRGIRRDGWM